MQIIGCPTCGNPLEEPGGRCAQCGKTGLSSEAAPDFNETASVRQMPLTDIPVDPDAKEKTHLPSLLKVETVSHAVATLAPAKGLTSLAETEPALQVLPGPSSFASDAPGLTEATPGLAVNAGAKEYDISEEAEETESTIRLPGKATRRSRQQAASPLQGEADATISLPGKAVRRQKTMPQPQTEAETTLRLPDRKEIARKRQLTPAGGRMGLEDDLFQLDETAQDDVDDEEMSRHDTWHTEVPHRPSRPVPAVRKALSQPAPAWFSRLTHLRATRSFFWLTTLVLVALLLSGAFGIAVSFGRTRMVPNPPPALLVSPATIEMGGIVTIRGTHFTPGGEVTLSRDQHITLLDTGNVSTLQANAQGSFTDTIVADPQWLAGKHILYATDTRSYKQALVPLLVTGKNALQGPPHLLLSSNSLDLGAGDQVTNASKLLALSNAGGGVATWQASASQSWLQITPQSGSVPSGNHISVIVAADRSRMAPGTYQATITFTSNTGQLTLPVSLKVTPLQQSHEAIMQVSPATLAFEGAARGSAPGQRIITISNPGSQPLVWSAGVHGAGWLWAAPSSGTVAPGGQQTITVGVTTSGLGSGVYKGEISFVNQGSRPAQGSPQSVYVSLTVTPACTLTLSTSSLSFSGQHGGTSPASKSLSIGVAQGCQSNQSWSATISGAWLHVSASHGTTPAKINVSANTAGLAPGTYKGTLTLNSSAGSQLLTVTLTVMPVPCSVSGSSALSMQGTAGQSSSIVESVPISASGDCAHALSWTSSSSSSWLSASPSGTFTSSASLKVQADLSNLGSGTYSGTVTVSVVDSVTGQAIGSIVISVTLTAQPPAPPADPCALASPSPTGLSFSASAGSNPATPSASLAISVTGSCSESITITPSADDNGGGWLSVSGPVTIASGSTATFTVTVTSASLASGTYSGTITLSASNGIAGSPRSITVTLVVQ